MALASTIAGNSHWLPRNPDRALDHIPGEKGLPVIGVYGTSQIAPLGERPGAGNGLFQNSVVTALLTPRQESEDV